jgi:hypothetical protein
LAKTKNAVAGNKISGIPKPHLEVSMNSAQRIISRFGGQTTLAEALHTKQSTVQYWAKSGTIPAKWHRKIAEAAVRRGITLSGADFSPLVAVEPAGLPRRLKLAGPVCCLLPMKSCLVSFLMMAAELSRELVP